MTKRARRNRSVAFKAKVALAALKGDKSLTELAQQFDVHAYLERIREKTRAAAGPLQGDTDNRDTASISAGKNGTLRKLLAMHGIRANMSDNNLCH